MTPHNGYNTRNGYMPTQDRTEEFIASIINADAHMIDWLGHLADVLEAPIDNFTRDELRGAVLQLRTAFIDGMARKQEFIRGR